MRKYIKNCVTCCGRVYVRQVSLTKYCTCARMRTACKHVHEFIHCACVFQVQPGRTRRKRHDTVRSASRRRRRRRRCRRCGRCFVRLFNYRCSAQLWRVQRSHYGLHITITNIVRDNKFKKLYTIMSVASERVRYVVTYSMCAHII